MKNNKHSESMIPKIVHQTWKTHTVPQNLLPFHQTWQRPGWTVKVWSDADNEQFVRETFPDFYPTYQSYPHHIQRVDAVRYLWLCHYGGVYADLDMQCLRPLDPIVDNVLKDAIVLGQENELHYDGSERVGNAIMMSTKGHPFWPFFIRHLKYLAKESDPQRVECALTTTGPHALHEAIENWRMSRNEDESIKIYPAITFYPKKWEDAPQWGLISPQDLPHSYTVHHWQGTWRPRGPNDIAKKCPLSSLSGVIILVSAVILIGVAVSVHRRRLK